MKLAGLLFIAILSVPLAQARPANQFVVISDIHFNPLADPALASKLMAAEPGQWETLFANQSHPPAQHYGEDSVWSLLASLVSEIQSIQPSPKLMVVTGDILPHKFQEKFVSATKESDPAAFRSFVQKTVAFVGLELAKASGGAPVIYTLGNNDDECGDYSLEPGGPFLEDTAGTVQKLSRIDGKALESWLTLGSYVTVNPLAPRHRIIALDTTFWSRRYANTCGNKESNPGADELKWLAGQLHDAQRHGDKVWIVYHIPPGIDGHSSSHANQVIPMWKPEFAASFNELLDQYRATIAMNFASHTHLDDFRLVKTENATTLVLMNPGLSPNVGQNPAFRIIRVDDGGRLKDLDTYFMPDLTTSKWQLEYDARRAFGLKNIDAKSYAALYKEIDESQTMGDKWRLYYAVSRPAGLNSSKAYLRSLYCASGHVDADSYQACLAETR